MKMREPCKDPPSDLVYVMSVQFLAGTLELGLYILDIVV